MRATHWFWRGLTVSLVLLVMLLAGVASLWTLYHPPDASLWIVLTTAVLSLWVIGVFLFVGVVVLLFLREGRTLLAEAIARNPGAFLEAEPSVPQDLPSLAAEPLTVLWRSTPGERWFIGSAVAMALVTIVMQLGTAPGMLPSEPPFSTLIHILSSLNLFFRLGIALGAVLVIALVVQTKLARPVGVVLSDAGIEMRRQFGRRRVLRWAEARRLEYHVSQGRYELRGEHRSVSWPRSVPQRARPLGISSEDAAARLNITLALVEERTGLRPRAVI